jgi:hypothetical protein
MQGITRSANSYGQSVEYPPSPPTHQWEGKPHPTGFPLQLQGNALSKAQLFTCQIFLGFEPLRSTRIPPGHLVPIESPHARIVVKLNIPSRQATSDISLPRFPRKLKIRVLATRVRPLFPGLRSGL